MPVELKVPPAGESISTVIIEEWLAKPGESVEQDQALVVIATDKLNLEVMAPVSGQLTEILKQPGDSAAIGEVLGYLEEGAAPAKKAAPKKEAPKEQSKAAKDKEKPPTPAAQRALATEKVDAATVKGTGKDGQILKEDVLKAASPAPAAPPKSPAGDRAEDIQPLSPLRKTIARRLVEAQQTAALLTTFNEADMTEVMSLRKQYQEAFVARHGIKLGLMSFFVKAAIEALKAFPALNAEIRGESIVFHNYYDIGVAVGGGKGLVVPILRNAERLGLGEIEAAIKDFGTRAQTGKLKLEELQGGTFTISNGGVYGSMMSTPIINPPQSGVLGLHKIMDRPIALNGQVVIRPMMYLALTYDHRLVDGREAVSFLVRIKECIENPARILLEV